jgi:hypothetical protein
VKEGAEVNVGRGGSLLLQAATCGTFYSKSKFVVEFLLNNGAQIEAPGGVYGTALHSAATSLPRTSSLSSCFWTLELR